MKLLLDTHVLFWSLVDHEKMPAHFRRLLAEGDHSYRVSVVTGWEIATKVRIGKWPEASVLLPGLTEKVQEARFDIEPLTLAQAERAGSLTGDHKDPFDRLLAAQAANEGLTLVTADAKLKALGAPCLW